MSETDAPNQYVFFLRIAYVLHRVGFSQAEIDALPVSVALLYYSWAETDLTLDSVGKTVVALGKSAGSGSGSINLHFNLSNVVQM